MVFNELFDGKYRIIRLLGSGGCGQVYLAENVNLRGYFAIKEIPVDEDTRTQVEREVELLKRLKHHALPRVFDVIRENGAIYIIEDYIEGDTAEKAIAARGAIPEPTAIRWGVDICDIMSYLHGQQPEPVIYRDLKPANIIISEDGAIRLIDFGSARKYKSGQDSDTVYIGTRGYAAPEQYGFGQTSVRSDVYSFGMTMSHIVTGTKPMQAGFAGMHGASIGALREDGTEMEARARMSDGLERIVSRCVQPNANMRYESFEAIRRDLLALNEDPPLLQPQQRLPQQEPQAQQALQDQQAQQAQLEQKAQQSQSVQLAQRAQQAQRALQARQAHNSQDLRPLQAELPDTINTSVLDLASDQRYATMLAAVAATGVGATGVGVTGVGATCVGTTGVGAPNNGVSPADGSNAHVSDDSNASASASQPEPNRSKPTANNSVRGASNENAPRANGASNGAARKPANTLAPSAPGASAYLLAGRCAMLSVVGNGEFACELAYRAASHHRFKTIVLDFDFERQSTAWHLCTGLGKQALHEPYSESPLKRAVDAVGLGYNNTRSGILSLGAPHFATRGERWPDGLHLLNNDRANAAKDLARALTRDNGRFLCRFLLEMTAQMDVCVMLAGSSLFSKLTALCFQLSHSVIYAASPDMPSANAFNTFAELAEDVAGVPSARVQFVAWEYDDKASGDGSALQSLGARSVLGGVRGSRRRAAGRSAQSRAQRGMDAGAPSAAHMERNVQKDYDEILYALGICRRDRKAIG